LKEQFPYVPWYHGDFLKSTAGWMPLERFAYWMLLCAEWESGPLPNEPYRLAAIACVQPDEFVVLWQHIGHKFVKLADGRWVNERMETHRKKYLAFRRLQVEGGRKGGKRSAEARSRRAGNVIDFPNEKGRDPISG